MIVRARKFERYVYAIGDCDGGPNLVFIAYKKVSKKTFVKADGYTLFEDHATNSDSHFSIFTNEEVYFLRRGYFFGDCEKEARKKIY